MSALVWIALGIVALYAALVLALVLAGRRAHARAIAGFVPDCAVLFKRLLGDSRVPRSRKLAIGLLGAYLASPIDLVPDFIPVAGQVDDAILVALVLRGVIKAAGEGVVREHWPGPEASLGPLLRMAGVR
jgi:uncharacterized membrane protein YkvA (DUF1232 family)